MIACPALASAAAPYAEGALLWAINNPIGVLFMGTGAGFIGNQINPDLTSQLATGLAKFGDPLFLPLLGASIQAGAAFHSVLTLQDSQTSWEGTCVENYGL